MQVIDVSQRALCLNRWFVGKLMGLTGQDTVCIVPQDLWVPAPLPFPVPLFRLTNSRSTPTRPSCPGLLC